MPLCCVECKPCSGAARALFQCRRPTFQFQLRRAFGKMKVVGGRRRRRRAGSFSSVRAVFWPLVSMRSDTGGSRVNDDRPPSASTDDDDTGAGAAASVTAARVLAIQQAARIGEAVVVSPTPASTATTTGIIIGSAKRPPPSPARDDDDDDTSPASGATTTAAARVLALALQTRRRFGDTVQAPLTTQTPTKNACSVRVQAVREQANEKAVVEDACRRFEKRLAEMLVDEPRVTDLLTDVEELLRCWEKLRCPVFVELVGRFYGELCLDLFSFAGTDAADASCI